MKNYLCHPLDIQLYIQQISDQSVENQMKEFFPIFRKASKWLKCVAEIIAFKDSD